MKKFILIYIIGAGLWACSSVNTISVHSEPQKVDSSIGLNSTIDSMIMPYRDSLKQEMDVVIAHSSFDFVVGRPGSNLGNWVADAIFANQTKTVRLGEPAFCMLNTGGIRSTINKGEITIGDMYKIMPFDNEIVWVKLPASALMEIEDYLKKSGGEPLSNAKMVKGKLEINGWRENSTHFWVITSDYLMNGGDKMNFFSKRTETILKGKLMRDALIEEAKFQQELAEDTTVRISF